MRLPSRGDVWTVDLNPVRGHEQAGRRPALVVSADPFNHGPAGLVMILAITSKSKGIRLHVPVAAREGGLRQASCVKCEQLRTISTLRLLRRLGRVSADTMAAVEDQLRRLLGLGLQ